MNKHSIWTLGVVALVALCAVASTPALAQNPFGKGSPLHNTPLDPGTWNPGDWISRPGGDSTSSLMVVPDPVVVRNPTRNNIAFFIDGRQQSRLTSGYRITYQTGSNSGNYRPLSIRFENGHGRFVQYALHSGTYHFEWTASGLDLFRDR